MRLHPSPIITACILCACLSGPCAVHGATQDSATRAPCASVTLDISQLPGADQQNAQVLAWGETARLMAQEQFLPVYRLLYPQQQPPETLSATLVLIRQADGIAWTSGQMMTANMAYFDSNSTDVGAIFHELVHVVQAYPRNDEGWLTEAIADWARYFWYEGHTLADYRDAPPGAYTDGYTNAARFLEWLRLYKCGAVVRRLNALMQAEGRVKPEVWTALGAAGLDELWAEYAAWCDTH